MPGATKHITFGALGLLVKVHRPVLGEERCCRYKAPSCSGGVREVLRPPDLRLKACFRHCAQHEALIQSPLSHLSTQQCFALAVEVAMTARLLPRVCVCACVCGAWNGQIDHVRDRVLWISRAGEGHKEIYEVRTAGGGCSVLPLQQGVHTSMARCFPGKASVRLTANSVS